MAKKIRMFHTQGFGLPYLTNPKKCIRDDAWLGEGYYFWKEEQDAIFWGVTAKKDYKKYSVYESHIDCENVLDTVFNEKHYNFWILQIEKAINVMSKNLGPKLTIKDINSYFMTEGGWGENVSGIMFQDLPSNKKILLVKDFYYKKRIQLAAFNKEIITNFSHRFDGNCIIH